MNRIFPLLPDFGSLSAILLREFRDVLINRYFQIFSVLSLLAGGSAIVFSEDARSSALLTLEISLYFVSLFALLAGASSAQAEKEEWQLLFAQPVPRTACVVGKFISYLSVFAVVLVPLFLPALLSGSESVRMALLYLQTLLLAAVFLALGLVAGFFGRDRAQSLILGVSAWLLLLFGSDLVALFVARWPIVQRSPDIWVAFMMLNPLDSFRVQALFAWEQIPAEAANKTALAAWWIDHAGLWFGLMATVWTAGLIALSGIRLHRWEE